MNYPSLRISWLIWSFAAGLYLVGFFQRVAPAVLTQELMTDFKLTAATLGGLSAYYFYSYVAMQIPTGLLADRWGPRKLCSLGALFAAMGTLLFAMAPTLLWASVGRLLIGGSVAVAFVCMLKLAAHWMPQRHYSMMSGVALFCGVIGAVTAGVPMRIGVDQFGWRMVMCAAAFLTFILAILIWRFVRDDPGESGFKSYYKTSSEHKTTLSVWNSIKTVFSYRNTLLLYFVPGSIVGAILSFTGLWGVPYLRTHYALDEKSAAAICSAMMIAWAIGGPLFGWLSDYIGRRKPLYILGNFVQLLAWGLVVGYPGLGLAWITSLLIVIGFFGGSMIISFAFARESVPSTVDGTAAGVMNMGVMMGPMLLQPLVGYVLDQNWTGELLMGVRSYDLPAYQTAFSAMLVWLVVASLLIIFTKESFCKPIVKQDI